MKESSTIVNNNYHGMVFQNCNMSNATIQTINTPTTEASASPQVSASAEDTPLPSELDTPQAHEALNKLVQAGMLDEQWQPVGLTLPKKGVLASLIAAQLNLKYKWKTFGLLWRMSPDVLRTKYNEGMDQIQMMEFITQIKSVLQ